MVIHWQVLKMLIISEFHQGIYLKLPSSFFPFIDEFYFYEINNVQVQV